MAHTVWIKQFFEPPKSLREQITPKDMDAACINALRDGMKTASEVGQCVGRKRKVITVRLYRLVKQGLVQQYPSKNGLAHLWGLK